MQPNKKIDKYKFTNILRLNMSNIYVHLLKSELKGLVEVDATGAVFLIEKSLYKRCKYAKHLQGEDMPFCSDIRKISKIYCDTMLKLPHCMDLELLDLYRRGQFEY
jgi:hypothetical protein